MEKGRALIWLLIILLLVIIGGLVWYFWPQLVSQKVTTTTTTLSGWQTFEDKKVGFKIQYPAGWQVKDWSKTEEISGQYYLGWYTFAPTASNFEEATEKGISLYVSTKTYQQELELVTGYEAGILKERTEEDLTVDGQPAKKFTGYKVHPVTGETGGEKDVAIVIDGPVNPFVLQTKISLESYLEKMIKTLSLAGQREGLSEETPSGVSMTTVSSP